MAYVLVVGGPLLGLLGVLRLGQGIRAPMAVHGAWVFQVADPGASPPRCVRYLLSEGDSALRITQSGAQLAATLGPEQNVALRGALTGDSVRLTGTIDAKLVPDSVVCAGGDSVVLVGRASRGSDRKRLEGAVTGCAACAGVPFAAERPRGNAGRRRS